MSVHVKVDLTSLALSSKGTLGGIIYLELQDESGVAYYPDNSWSDIPVALLSSWLPALHELKSGRGESVNCRFMDGPFGFIVIRQPGQVWRVDFKGRLGSWRINSSDFLDSLTQTSRELVAECDQRDLRGADLEVLRLALEGIHPPAI